MPIRIGRIAGIPIALDYSWFVIFVLIVWSVAYGLMPQQYPGLSEAEYLLIGIVSALLLFGSVLLHELAHSIVAETNGLRIRRITLFLFGGVSEMEEEPRNPSLELKVSAAGPLTSLALAIISGALWELSVLARAPVMLQAPLQYAALVNAVVAVFNLIPAFPMDGGRVFRSLLWKRTGDIVRATRTASNIGRWIGYAMMAGGLFSLLTDGFSTGLWLILIGWFISSGAQAALGQTIIQEDLRDLRARDIMARNIDSVPPDMTLEHLSQELFRLKHNGFPVISDGVLEGCITMDDLRKVGRDVWPTTRVREIMTPRERLVTMTEEEAATRAIQLMSQNGIGRIFVLDGEGRTLSGIVTRTDILKTVEAREGGLLGSVAKEFTVEPGMDFVLEQPLEAGFGWTAEFGADGIQLVDEREVQRAENRRVKQFIFRANRIGRHSVRLVKSPVDAKSTSTRSALRTLNYTIIVGRRTESDQSGQCAAKLNNALSHWSLLQRYRNDT